MTNTKKGFTLIELLVVISIIALLLSILMPALNKVREQGKSLVCKSNLRSMGQISAVYVAENNKYLPGVAFMAGSGKTTAPPTWDDVLLGFGMRAFDKNNEKFSTKLFKCPADRSKMSPPGMQKVSDKFTIRSYAMNDRYYNNTNTGSWPGVTVGGSIPFAAIQRPAETAYIFELWTGKTVHDNPYSVYWGPEFTDVVKGTSSTFNDKWCHGKEANILYFDGHSDKMTLEALAADCGYTSYSEYKTLKYVTPRTWCFKKRQVGGRWWVGYEGPAEGSLRPYNGQ